MSVLLDTHVLLWFQSLDKRLPAKLRERVEQSDDDYFVSQVSLWEVAIKTSIGKLTLDRDLSSTYRMIHAAGFLPLPFREEHFLEVSTLPMHHRDPFDRMLIAQARCENLWLLTSDPHFGNYGVMDKKNGLFETLSPSGQNEWSVFQQMSQCCEAFPNFACRAKRKQALLESNLPGIAR